MVRVGSKNFPQGLKPANFVAFCGTAKAVPFQDRSQSEFFRNL